MAATAVEGGLAVGEHPSRRAGNQPVGNHHVRQHQLGTPLIAVDGRSASGAGRIEHRA